MPISSTLSSTSFNYTNEYLSNDPLNQDLGTLDLIIQSYDLQTSISDSTDDLFF